MKLYKLLVYLTNNDVKSQDEVGFDIFFFITNSIALAFGVYNLVWGVEKLAWVSFLWIEFCWALDNLRNNRTY